MPEKLSLITRETERVFGIENYPVAISDGHALDFNSLIPLNKYRQQKRWREAPAATLLDLLKQVEGNTIQLIFPAPLSTRTELVCYVWENGVTLQLKYVSYFQARYPGCQLWASKNAKAPVAVKHNDELVGLVMPI